MSLVGNDLCNNKTWMFLPRVSKITIFFFFLTENYVFLSRFKKKKSTVLF